MSITALMSSQDTAVFQGAVRFQVAQIEPVEQPQELLLAELDRRRPGNELCAEVGDGVNRGRRHIVGLFDDLTLHRRSDMPCRTITSPS